jgi:hypothetical protein
VHDLVDELREILALTAAARITAVAVIHSPPIARGVWRSALPVSQNTSEFR